MGKIWEALEQGESMIRIYCMKKISIKNAELSIIKEWLL